jgi:D-arabinose 1-dehydrogenase-like Zn-dependent alcohol dehydrogenase
VQTFKAYRTFEHDHAVSSRFVTLSLDELDPGDVVIRIKYSTINYKDALSYSGAGKIMRKFPTVAGIDLARHGRIEPGSALETRRQGHCPPATTSAFRTTAATPNTRASRPTGSCAGRRA